MTSPGLWRRGLCALFAAAALAGPASAQVPEGAALGTQEDHPTLTLPEASPHWVYVLEPVFPYLVSSKVWILDGDTLQYKGMVSAGYIANLALSHDKSAMYVTETYWSRGTRGDRTDVVTTYDAKTLNPTGEIILPKGRFLVVPKKYNVQISSDGRYLYSFNMDPAFGLSLVDLKENRYVGEIETGGCSLAYPTGPASVASLCPDGSFAHITIDAAGKASIEDGTPFFNSETDPVFEHAAISHRSEEGVFRFLRRLGLSGEPRRQAGGRRALEAPGRGRGGLAPGRLAARRLSCVDRPAVRADARGRHLDPQAGRRRGLGLRRRQRQADPEGAAGASLDLPRGQHGRPTFDVRAHRDRRRSRSLTAPAMPTRAPRKASASRRSSFTRSASDWPDRGPAMPLDPALAASGSLLLAAIFAVAGSGQAAQDRCVRRGGGKLPPAAAGIGRARAVALPIVELAAAVGLLVPALRPWAAALVAILLLLVRLGHGGQSRVAAAPPSTAVARSAC